MKHCDFGINFLFRPILCSIKHNFMSFFGQSHFMCFGNEKKKKLLVINSVPQLCPCT